ncbi:hypothetical protein Barb4_02732 [Bacteroidales bacterium Barb4]|nr:hypothetical protein Barb4_02732 [Bacteroidales bacterium Barb4]
MVIKLGNVVLPKKSFDIVTGLITNRKQATIEVSPTNGNGTTIAKNINFTGTTRTKTINIFDYTGNEVVTASAASVSYANGILRLTNLDGAIATIVSLNGRIAAKFTVSGDEVQKEVALTPGFYILNAGKTVTKFIVR